MVHSDLSAGSYEIFLLIFYHQPYLKYDETYIIRFLYAWYIQISN
jgi:hypothetical protein